MIYRMACDLDSNLRARKYPVRVVYGPERTVRSAYDSMLIVISRDTDSGDSVLPVQGVQRNPRKHATRRLGVVAELHVKSSVSGARLNEHEHECDALVDALIVSLDEWTTQAKAGSAEITEARYLKPDEYSGGELGAGVVYRMRFSVSRGVTAVDYDGTVLPSVALSAVGNASTGARVRLPGGAWETLPEPPDPPA